MIKMLDFRNKSEIAVSDILVGFLKVKPKVNENSGETSTSFISYLFQMDYQYKGLKYPIQNLKYPIKPERGG